MTLRITRNPPPSGSTSRIRECVLPPELRHPGIDESTVAAWFVSELPPTGAPNAPRRQDRVWFEIDTSTATAEAHDS
jgi:hypothetical protein